MALEWLPRDHELKDHAVGGDELVMGQVGAEGTVGVSGDGVFGDADGGGKHAAVGESL